MSQIKLSEYVLKLENQLTNLLDYHKSKQLMDLVKGEEGKNDYYSTAIFYSIVASIFALVANTFIGRFVGIFYPVYKLNKYIQDNSTNITPTIKYLYIYAHMEFIFQAAMILSIPFFKYIKLATTLFFMYSADEGSVIIDTLYSRFIATDIVIVNQLDTMYRKFITKS